MRRLQLSSTCLFCSILACMFALGGGPSRAVGQTVPRQPAGETSQKRAARGIAPHDEVCLSPEVEGAVERPSALLARKPSSTHLLRRRTTSPSDRPSYPDTKALPLDFNFEREPESEEVGSERLAWPEPVALFRRLDELAAERATGQWALEAKRLVQKLGPALTEGSDQATSIIRQLQGSVSEATRVAAGVGDKLLARKLARAGHALTRRLVVWEQIVRAGGWGPIGVEGPPGDPKQLQLCLAKVDAVTGDSVQGRAWCEYLLVGALRQRSAENGDSEDGLSRALAQRVLTRLNQLPMSTRQRQFVSTGPVAALRAELRRWAAEPVDSAGLLEHLERYERTGLASDARLLAMDCARLGPGSSDQPDQLAGQMEINYRNSNLRLTVTQELLNRLLPEVEPEYAPVHDVVLGYPVHGQSVTSTKLGMRLLSDPNRVRLALEITGQVASLTTSTRWPATFYNDSTAIYRARKPLEIDLKGIRLSPTEMEVDNATRLRKLRTDFDGVPLVGELVKRIALSQHDRKRDAVKREVRWKIAAKARRRIDSEVETRVSEVSENLHRRVLDPLEALRLDPTIVEARTTDRRLTIRLRLAGEDQLGGHTPRPRAPADSLASFQIHETAINNILQRLSLEGRSFTLPELSRYVAARLNRDEFFEIEPEHEDVTITFAKQDALGVRLRDGRAVLSLSIAQLRRSPRQWNDFQVHVFYRPRTSGRSARLSRDGIIQFSGRRISMGSQIALRGIFAKTFSRRRFWKLTPQRLSTDPKFADLSVTQFEIEDGWIGLAMGRKQIAFGSRLRRR